MITENQAAKKSSECIDSLVPLFRESVGHWYEAMMLKGIIPYIYFGMRSITEQHKLYERYISGQGPRAAKPGESFHGFGMAIDWVPLRKIIGAKGDWFDADWKNDTIYKFGEEVGKEFGLRAIYDAKGELIETGHLQDARFSTWQEAKRAYDLTLWPA